MAYARIMDEIAGGDTSLTITHASGML
jgi:hypothetical protein